MRKLAPLLLVLACRSNAPKEGPGGALVIASTASCPTFVAADGEHVYFATSSGAVGRVLSAGGKGVEELASGLKTPTALALGDDVYVGVQGSVLAIPKRGGAPKTLASGLGLVQGIATDGASVFFVDYNNKDTSIVASVPKSGGNVDRLQSVAGLVSGLSLDAQNLYFVAQHELVRLPKTGGFRAAVGLTVQGDALYADGSRVLVLDGASFVRVDKATGKTLRLAEFKGAPRPFIDARDVVWNEDGAKILAVSLEGGRPREVALHQPSPRAVTGDASFVYWSSCASESAGGTLSKKAR